MDIYERLDLIEEAVIRRGKVILSHTCDRPEGITNVLRNALSISALFTERRIVSDTVTIRLIATSSGFSCTFDGYTAGGDDVHHSLCLQGVEGETFWANKYVRGRTYNVPHGLGESNYEDVPPTQWEIVKGNTLSPERLEDLFK
jgi:hypothetical protein